MQITVKVKPQSRKKAGLLVRDCVQTVQPDASIEEVFPDAQTGSRAGLVTVKLPDGISAEDSDAVLRSLREQDEIEYAVTATPRKAR